MSGGAVANAARKRVTRVVFMSTLPLLPARRLEQLDGIAVGILQLDLFTGWTDLHLVAKTQAHLLQVVDAGQEILDAQDHAIPPAGFLALATGHRPRTGRSRAGEVNLERRE